MTLTIKGAEYKVVGEDDHGYYVVKYTDLATLTQFVGKHCNHAPEECDCKRD